MKAPNAYNGEPKSYQPFVVDDLNRKRVYRHWVGSRKHDAAPILNQFVVLPYTLLGIKHLSSKAWATSNVFMPFFFFESREWPHAIALGLTGGAGRTLHEWKYYKDENKGKYPAVIAIAIVFVIVFAILFRWVGGPGFLWMLLTLICSGAPAWLLLLAANRLCLGQDLDRMIALTADPCCLACGLSLHTAGRDTDGLTVCPRCDAAWRYPPLRPKCFTEGCDTDLTDADRDEDGTATCPSCKRPRPIPSWR